MMETVFMDNGQVAWELSGTQTVEFSAIDQLLKGSDIRRDELLELLKGLNDFINLLIRIEVYPERDQQGYLCATLRVIDLSDHDRHHADRVTDWREDHIRTLVHTLTEKLGITG